MPTLTEIKMAVSAVVILAAFAGGFTLAHRLDTSKYAALELSYARAQAAAVAAAQAEQARLDAVALQAAQAETTTQARIAAGTAAQLREVKRHVQANAHCVTWGLVRVLDAAVHGVVADNLLLPAGKSDDACAPFRADELARSVVGNYGVARANGEQLNALIDSIRRAREAHGMAK
jgi:hypothetical protein